MASKAFPKQASEWEGVFLNPVPTMTALSLDEEIAIYQFGQGVHSEANLLNQLSQLSEDEKRMQFFKVVFLAERLEPTESEIGQAIAESSLTHSAIPDVILKNYRSKTSIGYMTRLHKDELNQGYALLLHLFKIVYQRRFTLADPPNWRYWDLSNPEIVQTIRTKHLALVEEVYTNPGFRSEFASIAKFFYEQYELKPAGHQEPEPAPETQTHFTYLSYDEVVTTFINAFDNKRAYGISLLRDSLTKALSKQYGVDADQANRVVLEVIERHLRDTYNAELF